MWGVVPMAELKAYCDIRSFETSVHRLVVLPAKQTFSPEFGQTSPARLECFLKKSQNVMTACALQDQYNHPRSIRGRRRRRCVDVVDARRNRRFWIRIM